MAFDFLSRSKTYLAKTDPRLVRRRQALIEAMEDNYRLPPGRYKEVLGSLGELDIYPYSRTLETLRKDAYLIRQIYKFLESADPGLRRRMRRETKDKSTLLLIKCFDHDKIRNWSDICPESKIISRPPDNRRQQPEKTGKGRTTMTERSDGNGGKTDSQAESLHTQREMQYSQAVEGIKLASCQAKDGLHSGRGIGDIFETLLASLSVYFPEAYSQLNELADQVKEARQIEISAKTLGLPLDLKTKSGLVRIRYENRFLSEFTRFSKHDQKIIKKSIWSWSENQFSQALRSKKLNGAIPYVPGEDQKDAWSSRAARDIRFFWSLKKDRGAIIYNVMSRSDRKLYSSE